MDNTNTLGFIAIAVAIFLGMFSLALGIRNGLARSAAIQSGVSAIEYSHWVDDLR